MVSDKLGTNVLLRWNDGRLIYTTSPDVPEKQGDAKTYNTALQFIKGALEETAWDLGEGQEIKNRKGAGEIDMDRKYGEALGDLCC